LNPVFSFYLPKGSNGKITLGGYDLAQFGKRGSTENDITWSQVDGDEKTWSVNFNGAQFRDSAQIATKSEKIMLDTGLTYALVPTEDVEGVAKALMGFAIKCEPPGRTGKDLSLYQCTSCSDSNFKALKPIQLFIGGKYFDLPVSSYI
jgi:hypothetical protein